MRCFLTAFVQRTSVLQQYNERKINLLNEYVLLPITTRCVLLNEMGLRGQNFFFIFIVSSFLGKLALEVVTGVV